MNGYKNGYKYAYSEMRVWVKDYGEDTFVELTNGKDEAWANPTYIRNLSQLKKELYMRASEEVAFFGRTNITTLEGMEMIDLHFPKGRTDIKICGFIIRNFDNRRSCHVTERFEIAVRHL